MEKKERVSKKKNIYSYFHLHFIQLFPFFQQYFH